MVCIEGVMKHHAHLDSARKSLCTKGIDRSCFVQALESRTLLSAALPTQQAVPRGFSSVTWKGQATVARSNQWVLVLDESDVGRVPMLNRKLRVIGAGASVIGDLGRGEFLLKAKKGASYKSIFSTVRRIAGFKSLEPNFLVQVASTMPTDPGFAQQWALHNTGQKYGSQSPGTPDADIDAPEAWDITLGGSDIVVAVIDTGIQLNHPDLAANIWVNPGEIAGDGIDNDGNGYVDDVRGWNFAANTNNAADDHGHGTTVSGIIGAVANNGTGGSGAAWNVKILPLRFIDASGNGDTAGAIAALNYCIDLKRRGVNIVASNNSWGGPSYSRALQRAIVDFGNAGMIFVAAAGNNGKNLETYDFYPAAFDLPNIISVAATTNTDSLWSSSNYGVYSVDLGAPGMNIYSTARFSAYTDPVSTAGTSYAAPFVSAVVALAYSISPRNIGYGTIRDAVLNGGDPIAALTGKTVTGKRLNAYGALMHLPMLVLSATPGEGQVVATPPTSFTIAFSHLLAPASLAASDLTVNGIAADSVAIGSDQRSAVFQFNSSPVELEGVQSLSIAAGAIQRQGDAGGIAAFAGTFRYDSLTTQVIATSPVSGSIAAPTLSEIDLFFNEVVDIASLQTSDLRLSAGTVVGLLPLGSQAVRFLVSGLTETNLSMSLADGALTDLFGNPCAAWSGNLVLDVESAAFPPLTPAAPLGSRIHTGSLSAMINVPGDVDERGIQMAPGQQLSLKLAAAGGLAPSLELWSPAGTLLGSTSASANGKANLSLSGATFPGVYTIRIAGLSSTYGTYTLDVAVNADIEFESINGSANNTIANAQSLDAWFTPLPLGGQATSVLGRTDLPTSILLTESEFNDSISQASDASRNFVTASSFAYQIAIAATSSSASDLDNYNLGVLPVGALLTVAMHGQGSGRGTLADPYLELYRWNSGTPVLVASSDDDGPGDEGPGGDAFLWRWAIAFQDVYYVVASPFPPATGGSYALVAYLENAAPAGTSFPVTVESEPNDSFAAATDISHAWRPVQYTSSTSGALSTITDSDYYSFTLHAGDVLSVYVEATGVSNLNSAVDLLDSAGNVLASDDGFSNFIPIGDSGIWSCRIPVDGVYYVEVYAPTGAGAYTLNLNLSSIFAPPAPTLVPDYFSVSLVAGDRVAAAVASARPGVLALQLQDALGTPLADGLPGDGASSDINGFVVPWTGEYFLRVQGDRNLDYALWITCGASIDREPDNTPAQAISLDGTGIASGYLTVGDEDWFSFTVAAGDVVQLRTDTPGGPPGVPENPLDPMIEVYDSAGGFVAMDASSAADGRNALLHLTAGSSGTYRVRVLSQSGVGEYQIGMVNFNAGLRGGSGDDVYRLQLDVDGVRLNILRNAQLAWSVPVGMLNGLTIADPSGNDTLNIEAPLGFVPRLIGPGADTIAFLAGSYALSEDLGAAGRDMAMVIGQATVTSVASQRLRCLSISEGGLLQMVAGPGTVLQTGTFAMSGSGRLDLGNGGMILNYVGASPVDRLRQYLFNGLHASGPSIVTSGVTPDGHPAALAPFDNEQLRLLVWHRQTLSDGVDFRQAVIKFTYLGDVDLNGRVTPADSFNLLGHMSQPGQWLEGDLDYDGLISPADASILAGNLGAGTAAGMGL